MADIDLDAIEARVKAATPGPWHETNGHVGRTQGAPVIALLKRTALSPPNANLIAHAPTDIAALLAEVRRLREALERALHSVGSCLEIAANGCAVDAELARTGLYPEERWHESRGSGASDRAAQDAPIPSAAPDLGRTTAPSHTEEPTDDR